MASKNEEGHAINLANFGFLLTDISLMAAGFSPSKPNLKLTALQTLQTNAKTAHDALLVAEANERIAMIARKDAFQPLDPLLRRINYAVKASSTSVEFDNSIQTIFRDLLGIRVSKRLTAEEKAAAKAAGVEKKQNSSSHLQIENRINNFDRLIKQLTPVAAYAPNEADLKIVALTAKLNDLKQKQAAFIACKKATENARETRNIVFYADNTGLVAVANDCKMYIKSLKGISSTLFKIVSKYKFVNFLRRKK